MADNVALKISASVGGALIAGILVYRGFFKKDAAGQTWFDRMKNKPDVDGTKKTSDGRIVGLQTDDSNISSLPHTVLHSTDNLTVSAPQIGNTTGADGYSQMGIKPDPNFVRDLKYITQKYPKVKFNVTMGMPLSSDGQRWKPKIKIGIDNGPWGPKGIKAITG